MYLIETKIKDPKAVLYNQAYDYLKNEVDHFLDVTEPKEYDPDGYFEARKGDKFIGVAFVLDTLKPLVFRIEFEKTYGVSTLDIDEELLSIISAAIKKVFSDYRIKYF